jgi:hypothetical protein
MAGLTVTEKEHWKERIERRIDKRIESIWASDPNLKERIDVQARQKALESLKLAELQRESDQIDEQKQQLDRRQQQITRQMLATVRGVPVESVDDFNHYHVDREVESAVGRRQKVFEEELLAANDIGREIVILRQEKENLLDTIWLATSPSQLKLLWTKVAELLRDDTTQLQKDALAIPPVEAE